MHSSGSPANNEWTIADANNLCRLIRSGKYNSSIVYQILQQPHCDVNLRDSHGFTPLIVASEANQVTMIRLLLCNPYIDVNRCDLAGWSPLMHAAVHGHLDAVLTLMNVPSIDVHQFSLPIERNSVLIDYIHRESKKSSASSSPPPTSPESTALPDSGLLLGAITTQSLRKTLLSLRTMKGLPLSYAKHPCMLLLLVMS